MSESRPPAQVADRRRILAWALWDCGSTGIGAIVVTFVFSVYLTRSVGNDLPGDTSPASGLGWALFFSGLTVALLAPVTGVWVDAPHRRRETLAVLTTMVVLLTSAMSLIRDDASYLLAGLLLLGFTAACNDLASVPYNAMLRQLTTPETSGRVSGFGWAAGYIGSMVLLIVVYAGFIKGDGPTTGLLDIPTADGQNVRAAMLVTAAWMAV
ncbi:MAG TPA: MFS transporter, partial [Mycobacterium sp.]|nr:MFS transporter [Mycobacterium sp.]